MPQTSPTWITRIQANSTAEQLFHEAQTGFVPKHDTSRAPQEEPTYLPEPTDATRVLVSLALSGKGFPDIYGEPTRSATDFLYDVRRSLHRREQAAGHLIMPFDGSEFDARRNLREALADPQHFNMPQMPDDLLRCVPLTRHFPLP